MESISYRRLRVTVLCLQSPTLPPLKTKGIYPGIIFVDPGTNLATFQLESPLLIDAKANRGFSKSIESWITRWSSNYKISPLLSLLRVAETKQKLRSRSLSSRFSMYWQAKFFSFHLNRTSACHKQVECVHWIHWMRCGTATLESHNTSMNCWTLLWMLELCGSWIVNVRSPVGWAGVFVDHAMKVQLLAGNEFHFGRRTVVQEYFRFEIEGGIQMAYMMSQ